MRRTRLQQLSVILLGLVVAAVMVALGLWQLGVYGQQGSRVAEARAAAPAIPLDSVARPGTSVPDGYGRTVTATGRWNPRQQVLVPLTGQPSSYRVVTALMLPGGGSLVVVRGLTHGQGAAADRTGPPPPAGTVAVRGVLLPSETDPDSGPSSGLDTGLNAVELPILAQQWTPPLVNGFVTLDASEAGAQQLDAAPVALPQGQGRSRNAAYALQWWIFAAFAVAFSVRMVRDIGRRDDYEFAQQLSAENSAENDVDVAARDDAGDPISNTSGDHGEGEAAAGDSPTSAPSGPTERPSRPTPSR